MTDYNAGSARATYELDISPFRQNLAEIKRGYAEIARAAAQARQIPSGTQTVVPRREAPNARPVGGGSGVNASAAEAQRAAVAAARLAAEQNKAALAAQRLSTEQQRTAAQLANTERAETQAAAAALRYSQQQARANAAASGGRSGFGQLASGIQGVQAALGAVGIGLGAAQLLQGALAAGRYSASLGQTEGVLRQLAGSQQRYGELTRIAAENQRLFGGTLADNYAPLTGVLALSNQTGASLQQLNQASQLLLAKAPTKNAGDAFFGLGEFLSSNGAEAALSLADQFNLSKKALAELAREGVSAEDRLNGLFKLLADQGVTSETLNARLTDQATAYNSLGAAADQAFIRLGNGVNIVATPVANFLAGTLNQVTQIADKLAEARSGGGVSDLANSIAGGGFAAPTSSDTIVERPDAAALQDQIRSAIIARTIATQNSSQADIAGYAAASQYAAGIRGAIDAARGSVDASNAAAVATLTQGAQADLAKIKNADLERALYAAAAGSETEAGAAGRLAQLYTGTSIPALAALISLLRDKAALEGGGLLGSANLGGASAKDAATEAAKARAAYERDLAASLVRSTGSTAQRLALVRAELATAAPYSERRKALLIEEAQLVRQAAQERQRAGTAAAKADAKDARAYEAEVEQARRAQQRIEDATRQHYESLRRLQEDYVLSSSRRQEDFELERQRLLAEGRIKEAQLLEEKFNREQRRAAEDNALARRRETEQAGQEIAKARAEAAKIDPAAQAAAAAAGAPAVAAGARAAQAEAVLAATAGQRPAPFTLQVQIAPTQVQIDGGTIVTIVWPAISQLVDAELTAGVLDVAVTAPPGAGQGSGVGGPTP